jgi:pyridoxine 5'-phosphate synthase (EC 2.6.99.2)
MIKLSVNINKIATLRNARGGNVPDLIKAAKNIQSYGADGITVHPRPDERHIRYNDVRELKEVVYTEFNIEGNPMEPRFRDLVLEVRPQQVTLVPDSSSQLTSNRGWDTKLHQSYLKDTVSLFQEANIRVSIFVDPVQELIEYAARTGTDRIELYTESYAKKFYVNASEAVAPYVDAAKIATAMGLEINAGHDLSLENLSYFAASVPELKEVSIGHALISDALYYGLENTVQLYKRGIL